MKVWPSTLRNGKGGLALMVFGPIKDYPEEPSVKRVDEVLGLLVAAEGHRREQLDYLDRDDTELFKGGVPAFLEIHERSRESERAYYQTLELLNMKLSRYRWEAVLSGDIDGFRSEISPAYRKSKWEFSGRGDSFDFTEIWKYSEYTAPFLTQRNQILTHLEEPQRSWELMEPFMIALLLETADKGEIWRVRRCLACHHWFYAIRGHQQFCGSACRRRHEAQDPAFKEKRRIYMRERYRPLQKELQERSLDLAKGKKAKNVEN